MLIGTTDPILKDALFQPTFRSVFRFLRLLSFRPIDSTPTISWSEKVWEVKGWKDQPDKPDDNKIYVL